VSPEFAIWEVNVRVMIVIIAAFLMVVPVVSGEEEAWRENSQDGARKATADNIKSEKGFGAQLLITDDKDYLEKWKTPTDGFYLHTVNSAVRGQPIFILIIFANPGINEKGFCDIGADIKITRPDGTISRDLKDSDCWRNMPPPPVGNIQLGKTSIGILIDEKDLAGRWKIEAVVKDEVKKAAVQLSNYFDVE
jgi:hypothetical protein